MTLEENRTHSFGDADGPTQAAPSSLSERQGHSCPYDGCGKVYAKASKLAQHVRSHTGERPFRCDYEGCDASYMRNEHLKAHQRRHLNQADRPFRCTEQDCVRSFWTSSQLKNHMQACHIDHQSVSTTNEERDYNCTEDGCRQSFHKRKQLRLHIREQHSDSPLTPQSEAAETTSCRELNNLTASESNLPFPCGHSGCQMRFPTNAKRKTHQRTHENGRYTCSMEHDAPQEGSDQSLQSRPYIYFFPNWSSLQSHLKACHPPVCPWPGCGKHFRRRDNLRAHYRRHEDRKLRLEMEAKVMEMSQEARLNFQRASSFDESASSDDEEQEESDVEQDQFLDPVLDTHASVSTLAPPRIIADSNSTRPSDDELVRRAAELQKIRPKRSGLFKDLSSPALSVNGTSSIQDGGDETHSHLDGASTSTLSASRSAGPFACSWNGCHKIFVRKSALSIHIRTTHLGEKPFECPDCEKRFAHKHLVSRHRRICPARQGSPPPDEGSRLRLMSYIPDGHVSESSGDLGSDTESHADASDAASSDEPGHASQLTIKTGSAPSNEVRLKLLDLLTGRGYSPSGAAGSKMPIKRTATGSPRAEAPPAKRKRFSRDRIFECPWTSIQEHLIGRPMDATIPHVVGDQSGSRSLGPPESDDAEPISRCEFRFQRIYDLRRHLRAQHGLDLEDRQVRAWLRFEEQQRPRTDHPERLVT